MNIRRKLLVLIFISVLLSFSSPVHASVYRDYKTYVDNMAKSIRKEVNLGGSDLVKGSPKVTSADKALLKKAIKYLEKKSRDGYEWVFEKSFKSEALALGYVDLMTGSQYRYLGLLCDSKKNSSGKYIPTLDLGKENHDDLIYYIKHEKEMYQKLEKLYKKEIYPYRSKKTATKIAIAINVVDNYLSYDDRYIGNLPRALNRKKGLCADYSFMLDYFLKKMGYKAKIVSIKEKFSYFDEPGYHALNAVEIKGAWFYIDATNMDRGKYGVISTDDNIWFNASLNWVTFPGWKLRGVY